MKAGIFRIIGSQSLCKAIGGELKEIGYDISRFASVYNGICSNMSGSMIETEFTKEDYVQLYNDVTYDSRIVDKIFELPQQYDEALAFAKEQLSDKYWVKTPEKWDVDTYAVCVIAGVNWSKNKVGDIYLMTDKDEAINITQKTTRLSFSVPNPAYDRAFKWFATEKEAKEFVKTLKPNPTPKPKPVAKEVEPEFKVGDYVILAHNTHIGRITQINGNSYSYWGFRNSYLGFTENDKDIEYTFTPNTRLATSQEIEEFLIRVAKLKGYTNGCRVDQTKGYNGAGRNHVINNASNIIVNWCENKYYNVSIDGIGVFFDKDGNSSWATIIPESKPVEPRFTRTKKVEDLVYPDVVHCNSQEERDLLCKYQPNINHWTTESPYILMGAGGSYNRPYQEAGVGQTYVNYEFSNIIFPEEFVLPEKWVFEITSTNYPKFKHLRQLYGGITGYISSNKYAELPWGLWCEAIPTGYTLITFEQFEKHVLGETTLTKLPFGNLEFTIHKGLTMVENYASCKEGNITKEQIKQIVEWFNKDFTLLGHKMELTSTAPIYIKFGCCEGTREQAEAILKAFN